MTAFSTVLSGDVNHPGPEYNNSTHIIVGSYTDSSTILDGLTISGGYAGGFNSFSGGGGIYMRHGSPTIQNCIFRENVAGDFGGAIFMDSSSPTLANCSFVQNTVSGTAGAIYAVSSSLVLTDCSFIENKTNGVAGAIFSNGPLLTLTDCTFIRNGSNVGSSNVRGGAIYASAVSLMITRTSFEQNSARSGGAIYFSTSTKVATPILRDCQFLGNSASLSGGAIYTESSTFAGSAPTLINCIFIGNTAATTGGAITSLKGSKPSLINCAFVRNQAGTSGGAIHVATMSAPTVINSIFWGNTAPSGSQIFVTGASINVSFSDIQSGWTGGGNIDADPLFVLDPSPGVDAVWGTPDDDYGDLRLQATSPCIDAGDNASVPAGTNTDLTGASRFSDVLGIHDPGAIVDMGAYERVGVFGIVSAVFLSDLSQPAMRLTFSEPMTQASIHLTDLSVINLATGLPVTLSVPGSGIYDSATRSATWLLPIDLPDGNYRGTLEAESVSDQSGAALAASNSANLFSLAGDANHDRKVDIVDLNVLAMNWGGSGKVFSQGDFNYDGMVNELDLAILARNWQKELHSPPPAEPVSILLRPVRRTAVRVAALIQ